MELGSTDHAAPVARRHPLEAQRKAIAEWILRREAIRAAKAAIPLGPEQVADLTRARALFSAVANVAEPGADEAETAAGDTLCISLGREVLYWIANASAGPPGPADLAAAWDALPIDEWM